MSFVCVCVFLFIYFFFYLLCVYQNVFLLQFLMSGWANGYTYGCDLVDYSSSPQALRVCEWSTFF